MNDISRSKHLVFHWHLDQLFKSLNLEQLIQNIISIRLYNISF